MAALLKLWLLLVLACLASAGLRHYRGYQIVNPFVCTPGKNFMLDCNRCVCTSDGSASCTKISCPLEPDECIPGTIFEVGPEKCRCPACGRKWHSDCFAKNTCGY